MYKFQSKQMTIMDFDMPLGMELDASNRWVKKAHSIPWDAIEQRYSELFKDSYNGNVAKPLRLALGALIIKAERNISDEELVYQIQETPCLQYFCGLPGFTNTPPFDSSSVTYFRKRLTKEILGEINEMIIAKALDERDKDKPNPPDDEPEQPQGDLIVDATCVPQNIRYPQDLSLLNEAREKLENMIDELHLPYDGLKPRTYRRKARKLYLNIAKSKKKKKKDIRRGIRQQLGFIERNLKTINTYFAMGRTLSTRQLELLSTIYKVVEQQSEMYHKRTHSVADRIVSITQPWIRPIVRGKARTSCEFGAKIDVSVTDGLVRLEHTSFDAYNESENLIAIIERYKKRTKHYPARVLADKIYRTQENLTYCKSRKIEMIGRPLGRPKKDYVPDKKLLRQNEIDRIEVERKIGLAKGSYSLGLIKTRLSSTSLTAIAMSILTMNIAYITKFIFYLLKIMVENINVLWYYSVRKKIGFVQ